MIQPGEREEAGRTCVVEYTVHTVQRCDKAVKRESAPTHAQIRYGRNFRHPGTHPKALGKSFDISIKCSLEFYFFFVMEFWGDCIRAHAHACAQKYGVSVGADTNGTHTQCGEHFRNGWTVARSIRSKRKRQYGSKPERLQEFAELPALFSSGHWRSESECSL